MDSSTSESHEPTNQKIPFFPLLMLLRKARLQQEQTSQSQLGLKQRHSQHWTSATCAFPQTEVCAYLHAAVATLLSALGLCLRYVSLSRSPIFGSGVGMPEKAFEAWGSCGLLHIQPMAWGMQGSSPDERQRLHLKHITNNASTWLCTIWDSKSLRRHSSCGSKFLCKCKILRFVCANRFSVWERHNYRSNICGPQLQVHQIFPDLAGAWSEGLKLTDLLLWTQFCQHSGSQRYFIII